MAADTPAPSTDQHHFTVMHVTPHHHVVDKGELVSCITRYTSHVTRHTPHVTRHKSHVTRHTSHILHHILKGTSLSFSSKQPCNCSWTKTPPPMLLTSSRHFFFPPMSNLLLLPLTVVAQRQQLLMHLKEPYKLKRLMISAACSAYRRRPPPLVAYQSKSSITAGASKCLQTFAHLLNPRSRHLWDISVELVRGECDCGNHLGRCNACAGAKEEP